jgi:hypothetical protein
MIVSMVMLIAIGVILISGNITNKCNSHIDFNVDGICDDCGKKTDVANNQNVYDLENAVNLFNQFNDFSSHPNGFFSLISINKHIGNINITSSDSSMDITSTQINKLIFDQNKLYASLIKDGKPSETVVLFDDTGYYTVSQSNNKWSAKYSSTPLLDVGIPELPDLTISDVYFDSEQNAFVVRSDYFKNSNIDNDTQTSTLVFKINENNEIFDAYYVVNLSANGTTMEMINTHYTKSNGIFKLSITERNPLFTTTQLIEYTDSSVDTISYEIIMSATLDNKTESVSVKMQGDIIDETSSVTITPEMQTAIDETKKINTAHKVFTEKFSDTAYRLVGLLECSYVALWDEELGVYAVFEKNLIAATEKYVYIGASPTLESYMCTVAFNTEALVVTKHCMHNNKDLAIITKYAGDFEYSGTEEFVTVFDTQYNAYVTFKRNDVGFYRYYNVSETVSEYKLVTVDWVGRDFLDITE